MWSINSLLFFLIRLVLNNPSESKIFNSKNNLLSKTKNGMKICQKNIHNTKQLQLQSLTIDQQDLIIWSASVIYGCKRCFSDFFPFFLINTIAHPIIEKTKEETMRVFISRLLRALILLLHPLRKKYCTNYYTNLVIIVCAIISRFSFFSRKKNTPKHCDKNRDFSKKPKQKWLCLIIILSTTIFCAIIKFLFLMYENCKNLRKCQKT